MKINTVSNFEIDMNTVNFNVPYLSNLHNFLRFYAHETKSFLFKLSHQKEYKHRSFYYKRLLNKYNDIDSYSSIYENFNSKNCVKTNVEICFSKLFKFNSNIKDIKRRLYNANYNLLTNRFFNIEILSFKMLIGNQRVKCQMHFYERKLFLYNYTFTDLKHHEKNEIFKIILKKYVHGIDNYTEQNIIDNFNNCIQINNDFQLSLNYFSMDCDFHKQLTSILKEKEEQREREMLEYHKNFAIII